MRDETLYGTPSRWIPAPQSGDRSHQAERMPLRREGTIEGCAKVVEFLATDLSDYVTGRTIVIDGGLYRGLSGMAVATQQRGRG